MKNLLLAFTMLLVFVGYNSNAQTLFTYGPYAVSKAEFLAAFKKNNTQVPGKQAYQEYLDLYIKYKLKVRAAKDLHLDTLPSQLTDLEEFRKQVINNYLIDEASLQKLTLEAMINSAKDLRISHIYIPFSGADSAAAKSRSIRAMQELSAGKSFETVAQSYSGDSSVNQNKGDIGWITAFVLPYPLEKLAYGTALNSNSELYKSNSAYHIFRVTAERPAEGMIQVAQILISLPPTPDAAESAKAEKLADSLYKALQSGADFGKLAQEYSKDNSSYNNQGVMQAFYPGTYDNSFEEKVFSLQKANELSAPFRTSQGFHIVKRMGVFKYSTDITNPEAISAMRTRVLNDARVKVAMDTLANSAKRQLSVKRSGVTDATIQAYTTDFLQGNSAGTSKLPAGTLLLTIEKEPVRVKDYNEYLAENTDRLNSQIPPSPAAQVFQEFLKSRTMSYYLQHLELYNKKFAAQLQEFKDGNMIFEAMQVNVWDKAVNDEAGQKRYYQAHHTKYNWKESLAAVLFTGVDSAAVQTVFSALKINPSEWKSLVEKTNGLVQADSGRFEADQIPELAKMNLAPGTITNPTLKTEDLTTNFIYIIQHYPPNQQRSFEDAKGMVLNDYQNEIEDAWIKQLKKKYPIKVNMAVLNSLNR